MGEMKASPVEVQNPVILIVDDEPAKLSLALAFQKKQIVALVERYLEDK